MGNQITTFYIDNKMYGLDVMDVQEVTRPMQLTDVPMAPSFVSGLINLRGQIATGIGLRELFKLEGKEEADYMNVVCKVEDSLVSLQVDRIGDVIQLQNENFEEVPDTLPGHLKKFMDGVYKLENELLSIVNVQKIFSALQNNN